MSLWERRKEERHDILCCFTLKGIEPLLSLLRYFLFFYPSLHQSPVLLVGEPSLHPDVNQINGTCFTRVFYPTPYSSQRACILMA